MSVTPELTTERHQLLTSDSCCHRTACHEDLRNKSSLYVKVDGYVILQNRKREKGDDGL